MCQESVGGVILDRDVARPQFLSQKTDAAAVTASHPLKIIPLKLSCNQTSYLSKDLRDRNFGPQKFTQKKTEFAIKQVRDKIM